ncbi:MAG: AfsR family transcriptional regulator [Aeromicrobium sp.]|nr:AfsR family transcriptional regulator [Aeromicrobium sp.]
MNTVQVDVLGPLQVRVDDREVDLGGPRSRALVARLALDAGRPVGATTLIDDLWGLDVPADAVNALQSVVSRTRRKLPDGALESTPAGYVLHCDSVDALEFERLSGTGRPGEALALWRGAALADVLAFPFAVMAATRLDELRLSEAEASLEVRAIDATDAGVVAELADLTAAHPYRDGFWRLYLTALASHGRTNEALTAYEGLRGMLADELGADPSPALQELHLALLRGETARPGRMSSVLPVGVTTFVGRERAIDDLTSAIGAHRLVTILGPGGAGKTRLAIESARAGAAAFDDVCLVELAPVTNGNDIVSTILSTLGLLEISVIDRRNSGGATDERTRLLDALAELRMLLILDNCEHLIDDVAAVAEDVLTHAPRLVVLTTSREPLRILGEYVYPVDPLTQPSSTVSSSEALGYSAVQLFVQRAQAADPAFTLDDVTLPSVLEICARLDGQPLAIELAAARLRSLAVDQVAARLSDRFRLLTGGSRTALPRHRTLRAVVEWSWDLLDDDERDLAERIAVFPGGLTAASAAAVFDDSERTADLLESLADKSLLVAIRAETPRFRMLETLREYGTERLIDRGIVQKVRTAHVDHFLAYAKEHELDLRGPRQLEAFAAFDLERGNISAALRFAIDQQDRDRAARMLATHGWYWATRNQDAEVLAWAAAVGTLPGQSDPTSEICVRVLQIVAAMASDNRGVISDYVEEILELHDTGEAYGPYVDMAMATIDFFGKLGDRKLVPPTDPWTRAAIVLLRVVLMDNAGTLGGDTGQLDEAIEGFLAVGDRWGLATSMGQRATLEAYAGDADAALATLEQTMPLLEELGATEDLEFTRMKAVGLRLATATDDDLPELRRVLEGQLAEAEASGMHRTIYLARLSLAAFERIAGRARESVEALQNLLEWEMFDDTMIGSKQMKASVLAALSLSQVAAGDLEGAKVTLAESAINARASEDMPVVSQVAVTSACLAFALGDHVLAARRLGAADSIRGVVDALNRDAQKLATRLREQLGSDAFEHAYADGLALERDEAIGLTLPGG